jgi:hypothetical protein
MQKTLHSVASVSFVFFVAFGILHIVASILISQGLIARTNWLIFNVLDLPFLLAALTYGTSKLSLTLENITGKLKIPLIVCGSLAAVVFLIALYFNFGLTDAQIF